MTTPQRVCQSIVTVAGLALLTVHVQSAAAVGGQAVQRYEVRVTADLDHLIVSSCFRVQPPKRLRATGPLARQALEWMRHQQPGTQRDIKPRLQTVSLSGLKPGDCLQYRVDMDKLASWRRWQGRGVADDVQLTNPDDWLWLPSPDGHYSVDVRFELPPGIEVSVPWQRSADIDQNRVYRLPERAADWNARVAIGRLTRFDIPLSATSLRVAVLPGRPAVDIEAMRDWITSGARAMAMLYDQFPAPQILIIPVGRADEPIPWAEVQRGGGEAVHLYIDQHRGRQAFIDDWTLVHELSHLLHPRLPKADAWLYEGLASYYQNILRARAGLLTPLTAWRKLHAGFRRGVRNTTDRQSLARVARAMHRNQRYMQVYWSGAAYALAVDTRLRQLSGGRQSLDSVLAQFQACCLPADKRWRGQQFVDRLDALSGTTVFSDYYYRYQRMQTFPRLASLYNELGLVAKGGQLQLDDSAPLAGIRLAIMSAPVMANM